VVIGMIILREKSKVVVLELGGVYWKEIVW